MTQNQELASAIAAGAYLVGSTQGESPSDLKSLLVSRLIQYDEYLGCEQRDYSGPLEEIQLETGRRALDVVARVQVLLIATSDGDAAIPSSSTAAPTQDEHLIGTRDLSQIRTLISLIFKWAIDLLATRVIAAIPTTTPGRRNPNAPIVDLTSVSKDFELLASLLNQLVRILLPEGVQGTLSPTHISLAVLDRHLADLAKPCIVLGWLPQSLTTESMHPLDDLRPVLIRLITLLTVQQSVTALTSVLPEVAKLPYARKACTFLLSRQLLRRDGVPGTLSALFNDVTELSDQAPLERFEQVSRLLQAIPTGMKPLGYYGNIIPQLIGVLTAKDVPPVQLRAAAFALSRMLASETTAHHQTDVARIVLPIFHLPFLQSLHPRSLEKEGDVASPSTALATLQALLINTDPSPTLISRLLTPIIPALFSISSQLENMKFADPWLKASLQGFLGTWGRVVGAQEGIATVWLIVEGAAGGWQVDIAGEITRKDEKHLPAPLALFTPEDLQRSEEAGEFNVDANLLKLQPDPIHFVRYLKSIDRVDITSEIFVMLLEGYRRLQSDSESDPMRTLLYLQIVVQVQQQLSSDQSPTNILKKSDHILSFIKHALDDATSGGPSSSSIVEQSHRNGLGLEDLKVVEEFDDELLDDQPDSDDEETPTETVDPLNDDDMTSTALTLLLSILEANPDLSTENTPVLDEIFELVVSLALNGTDTVKPLAREARMVLTARLASTSVPAANSKASSDEQTAQGIYQKALKLLEDPLLPVRAHGLLLLRQLVSPRVTPRTKELQEPILDKALVPGILHIFLQSLQGDDSYIFLNAVQGLAAMVDGFGRDTLKGLLNMYAQGLDGLAGGNLSQQDVDTRTRIGEALGQVIRRCGDALPMYSDLLAPALFAMVRTGHLPTPLRVSALSLLAQCVNTSPLALLYYTEDLFEALLDLLLVEVVPLVQRPGRAVQKTHPAKTEKNKSTSNHQIEEDLNSQHPAPTMDSQPTSVNSKFPPLRRAALHFLSLLARALTSQIVESDTLVAYSISDATMRRAEYTIGYVAVVDEDSVVRVMAAEALDGLRRLSEVLLGF